MTRTAALLCASVIFLGVSPSASAQKAGPRIYISVDMEGIWGVVHGDQVSATSPEYGAARRWMAEDVNAVVAGLLEAGAGEVVVNDSHGSMRNIVADALNPKVSIISGSPKPRSRMQGIDGTYDAVVFVGYHARPGEGATRGWTRDRGGEGGHRPGRGAPVSGGAGPGEAERSGARGARQEAVVPAIQAGRAVH